MKHLKLRLNERAVLVRDGRAIKALGPGRYTLWKDYVVVTFDIDKLAFTAPAVVLAGIPADWYETVQLAPAQYAIVNRDERPVAFLRPGVHRLWKLDPDVRLRVYAETDPLPPLTDELRALIPAGELVEATLDLNQRAVLVRDVWNQIEAVSTDARRGLIVNLVAGSLIFGLFHLSFEGASWRAFGNVFVHAAFGFLMGVVRWRTRSVAPGAIVHGLGNLMFRLATP